MVRWTCMLQTYTGSLYAVKGSFLDGEINHKQALSEVKRLKRKVTKELTRYDRNVHAALKFQQLEIDVEILEYALKNLSGKP